MKMLLILIVMMLGGFGCNQKAPSLTPAGSIHTYNAAQLKVLKQWQERQRVNQVQQLSPEEIDMFMRKQLTRCFRQPIVLPPKKHKPFYL